MKNGSRKVARLSWWQSWSAVEPGLLSRQSIAETAPLTIRVTSTEKVFPKASQRLAFMLAWPQLSHMAISKPVSNRTCCHKKRESHQDLSLSWRQTPLSQGRNPEKNGILFPKKGDGHKARNKHFLLWDAITTVQLDHNSISSALIRKRVCYPMVTQACISTSPLACKRSQTRNKSHESVYSPQGLA